MKKYKLPYIVVISLVLMYCITADAQCWDDINTETTDWRVSSSGNTFNWTDNTQVHDFYISEDGVNYTVVQRRLPYFYAPGTSGTGSSNTNFTNYWDYTDHKEVDVQPEDGWELLLKNFGTSTDPIPDPFFLLYNRYTGRLKAFIMISVATLHDNATIQIGFADNSKSDVGRTTFILSSAVAPLPSEFSNRVAFYTVNHYAHDSRYWITADIPTHYDPCTCNSSDGDALVKIKVDAINTLSVNLTQNGIITEIIKDGEGKVPGDVSGGSSELLKDGKQLYDAAKKGYDTWKKAGDSYYKDLENGSKTAKELVEKEWFKEHWTDLNHPRVNDKEFWKEEFEKFSKQPTFAKSVMGFEFPEKVDNLLKLGKGLSQAAPYVGTAISLLDFVVSGGGTTEKAEEKRAPMVSTINTTISGTITDVDPDFNMDFYLPGTTSTPGPLTPIYNNPLGVLTVLEVPNFKYSSVGFEMSADNVKAVASNYNASGDRDDDMKKLSAGGIDYGAPHIKSFVDSKNYDAIATHVDDLPSYLVRRDLYANSRGTAGVYNGGNPHIVTPYRVRSFKLPSFVKYIVNPATKASIKTLEASFVIEYNFANVTDANAIFDYNTTTYADYCLPALTSAPKSKEEFEDILALSGLEVEFIPDDFNDNLMMRIRTPYMPLNTIDKQTFNLWDGANKPKVYLKLYSQLQRNDNATAEPILYVVTYDITKRFLNATKERDGINVEVKCDRSTLSFQEWEAQPQYRYSNDTYDRDNHDPQLWSDLERYWNFSYITSYTIDYKPNSIYPHSKLGGIAELLVFNNGDQINGEVLAKNIIINSGVVIGNGSIIHGVEGIDVNNNNEVFSKAILRTGNYFETAEYTQEELFASTSEITSFCQSTAYTDSIPIVYNKVSPSENKDTSIRNRKSLELNIKLYPNPTSGKYILDFNSPLKDLEVSVLDLSGKRVSSVSFDGEHSIITLDASDLGAGVYFIDIRTINGHIGRKRFIKY